MECGAFWQWYRRSSWETAPGGLARPTGTIGGALHDYYAIAISPAVAGLVGGGLDRVMTQAGRRRWVVAAVAAAISLAVLLASSDYWTRAYRLHDPNGVLEGAAIVRAATADDELVDLGCAKWNPAVMFYAGRRGFVAFGDGSFTTFDDPRVCVDEAITWGVHQR